MNQEPFFQPDQLLPESSAVKIVHLEAAPYPDNRRVQVIFRLSAGAESLGAAVVLTNQDGEQLASATIVNLLIPRSEVTLHIPKAAAQAGDYQLDLTLFSLQEVESELEPGKVGAIASNPLDSRTISVKLQ